MADSKPDKSSKKPDAFADDLDSLLSVDDNQSQQNVGLIDDDDAIDRLLVNDAFDVDDAESAKTDQFGDFDSLLADASLSPVAPRDDDFDEFADDIDELIAKTPIDTPVPEVAPELVDEFGLDDTERLAPDNLALPDVERREELVEDALDALEDTENTLNDAPDVMREIDEFSDAFADDTTSSVAGDDFLTADFDISSDDPEAAETPADELIVAEQADAEVLVAVDDELVVEPTMSAPPAEYLVRPATPTESAPGPSSRADYSAAIAALTTQLADLKKLQKRITHELEQKAGQDELAQCLSSVETLNSGQKNIRRNLETVDRRKPVAAYVANGLAVLAILVSLGFGYQAFVANKQITEVVEFLGKLQKQIAEAPAADAGEKEILRKQLDELNLANANMASQIAELSKAVQAAGANQSAQPEVPGDHVMQMGAAIEAMQAKIAALEKGKAAVAPAQKPVVKKTVVVEQNWAVNLVAFKQDWYAKRKADEFTAKGVPAKVSPTENKGETWYRLSVDGFKTQYEAASYAARVKKTLNLDSVWVAKVKD